MPSLIVFDFDDTLAETEVHMPGAFYARLVEILTPHTAVPPMEQLVVKNTEFYRLHGSSLHGWMHELGKDMHFTLEMFKLMAPAIREAVMPFMVPNPDLHARLADLQARGHELAILTLGHRDYCWPLIEALELDRFFPAERVFDISVMEGRIKRDAATYRHLLDIHMQGHFDHKVMFEDSMRNLMAAKKAGFDTVLVGGKTPPHELDASVDIHVKDVLEGIDRITEKLAL